MRLRKARDQRGFTLIELLVVIAIIAILAVMLVPKMHGYIGKARVSRAMADLSAMKSVVEFYYADEGKGRYPGINNDENTQGSIANVLQDKGIKWTGGADGIKDPWGNAYRYGTAKDDADSIDRKFVFECAGPDEEFETNDDIWCSSESSAVQNGGTPDVDPDGWVYSS